ncbi:ATPase [Leeia sp. TBRC 13508]|uniref:ATPase n=1 Tax=Leeia speluncae TaxID=2884804 RepID=A0ABS8D433_9NEIS|nr:BadF/BadG/BcrA/BcrD ATPase family protein [Leeia speluncae]MCB6182892.1 ATPase [Leeia speluncae]
MSINYLVAVDGGGSSTRLALYQLDGTLLARVVGGPSALGQGVDQAWHTILTLLTDAAAEAGIAEAKWSTFALGLGLSGVHHQPWAKAFLAHQPGFGFITLTNDVHSALLGAHDGEPGVLMIAGTGSAGEVWDQQGQVREVGGWGFPSGDEASGAWIGLQAAQLLQKVMDGRLPPSPLSNAIMAFCGDHRAVFQTWLASAGQHQFGQLAPIVVSQAHLDPQADAILNAAAKEIERHLVALDPSGSLPICLAGGLAESLVTRLSPSYQAKIVAAKADAVVGSYIYLQQQLAKTQVKQ